MTSFLICFYAVFFGIAFTNPENHSQKEPAATRFSAYSEFRNLLDQIAATQDSATCGQLTNAVWNDLLKYHRIPFAIGDSVAFLFRGDASAIKWAGDFNGWNPDTDGYSGQRLGHSDLWILEKVFPPDARLDYKIIKDNEWILDPANPFIQYSGFGPNSELRMPQWVFPEVTVPKDSIFMGTLSNKFTITSARKNLGYKVNYRVYTPFGYETLDSLPVIYITDGTEYADQRMGAMPTVLDNLIQQQRIMPVIAVFIDHIDPDNPQKSRRFEEYSANVRFANFLADELVPEIDTNYKTSQNPSHRAILGTSLGGWNSAFVGFHRSETFGLIGIHSPAFDNTIIQNYGNAGLLPLKIFMSTGVFYDTMAKAREMKNVLESKGYPLIYVEVNEGHSWGNWRALLDEPLIWFFGITP